MLTRKLVIPGVTSSGRQETILYMIARELVHDISMGSAGIMRNSTFI